MKIDYTQLDAAILAAIESGFSGTEDLMDSTRAGMICRQMADKETRGKPAFRFLDARLQALRKRGSIKFDRSAGGWQLVSTEGAE